MFCNIFNNYNINDNKRCPHGSINLIVLDKQVRLFVTKLVILICLSFPDKGSNNCSLKEKGAGYFQN